MRVAFAGTPEFAVPTLLALMRSPHSLVGVLTQPDRPRGRGQRLTPSAVKVAAGASVPIDQPASLKTPADRAPLEAWRPDVLVVVAYGLLLPRAVLEIPRLGCVNVHPSLLPRWRGAAPIERALLAGDETTGVTIMLMDEGLDTGPLLLQRSMAIEATDTGASLREKLAPLGASLVLEALGGLAEGTLRPRPQSTEGVTYAPKLEKREAPIDWSRPAMQIERQIRAFEPWPVAETSWRDPARGVAERLLVHAARLSPDLATVAGPSGYIVAVNGHHRDGYIRVQCGTGCLDLLTLQRPGGPRLPAPVLTRGTLALKPHMRLGSGT
ncbi:MAG TPA: methionyl-tRNA formyltransferase [Steroidobacteraceae bacterium]|nr:methionyl-tRNA formyltransferase [Steroidobacteraceae bacterium]